MRGEPGIGKTRLVEEVQSIAANMGFARHMGWVLDFGTERGHGAVRTIVSGLLGLGRDASSQEAEAALSTSALSGDDTLYARDLLEIPQREEDRLLYEAIDRTARARAKERVLVDLIEAAAHANPLLVTVEDVHWADPETLALLAALARATTRSRTAVVMSTRIGADPFDAAWRMAAGDGLQLTINLTSLAPAEAETIARNFPAAEAFAAKCVERAGGNPLFLEQLLRTAGDLVEGKLPTTIQSVVLARTDLLAPNDKLAIEAASVLGQRLALANLRALIDDPHYACDALLRNALLRPVADGLQFVHALVRDGVYASLTRARRRHLHTSAAEVFLQDPALRAEHLDLAEDPQRHRLISKRRGTRVLFRQQQASNLALRGLAIANAPRDRVALALQVGNLKLDAGQGEGAPLKTYKTALSSGATESDRLRALIGCAAANRLLAKLDEAFLALSDAEPATSAGSESAMLAEIHYLRGNLHFARGDIEACRSEHAAALDAALRLNSLEWQARALSGLADAQYMDCRMATALKHFSECVERYDEAGLVRIAVPNRVMMGHCRIYVCDFDAALEDIRKALEMARRIGDSHAEMFALQSSGLCLTVAGRHDETVDIQAAAIEQARRLKARRYEAIILAVCGEQALVAGRPAEALSLVRSGLEASQETSPGSWAPSLWPVGPSGAEPFRSEKPRFPMGRPCRESAPSADNHFWFRRYAIKWALCSGDWESAERHAEALLKRTAPEPLPYSRYVARRGQLLARIARGVASDNDTSELSELRSSAAAAGLRMDALGEAMRDCVPIRRIGGVRSGQSVGRCPPKGEFPNRPA